MQKRLNNVQVPEEEDVIHLLVGRMLPALLILAGGVLIPASIVMVGVLLVCLGIVIGIGMEVSYRKSPLETKTLKEIADYNWCLIAKDEIRQRCTLRPTLSLHDLNVIRNLQLTHEEKSARIAENEAQQKAIKEISHI